MYAIAHAGVTRILTLPFHLPRSFSRRTHVIADADLTLYLTSLFYLPCLSFPFSGPLMNYFGHDPKTEFWRGDWTVPQHGGGRAGQAPRGRRGLGSSRCAESA